MREEIYGTFLGVVLILLIVVLVKINSWCLKKKPESEKKSEAEMFEYGEIVEHKLTGEKLLFVGEGLHGEVRCRNKLDDLKHYYKCELSKIKKGGD